MPPMTCALAKAKLSRYVAELREATAVEKTTTALKAGFLTAPSTFLKAAGGNAAWNAINELAVKPVAVAFDYLNAIGKSARTGFKVSPTELRTLTSSLDASGIGAMVRGLGRGTKPMREAAGLALRQMRKGQFGGALRTFVDELSTRLDAEQVANALEYDRVKYKNRTLQAMVDGAYAVQEAADRPYFFLSLNSSLYAQAKLMAMKEGAKGAELAARAARYFENPTDEMIARASDDAMWATFKDRGMLAKGASALKQSFKRMADTKVEPTASALAQQKQRATQLSGRVGSYFAEMTLPFTGVPSSIAAKTANMSPIGFLSFLTAESPQALARRVAVQGVGATLMALGYKLAKDKKITGAYPTNPQERGDWEARGMQPYSLRVGDYWVDGRFLAPWTGALFMGAAIAQHAEEPDATAGEIALKGAGETGRFLTEQTYLMGVRRVLDAITEPERKLTSLIASQIPTPAIVGRVASAANPYRRAPVTLTERIASRLGARATTPRAQGSLGELPQRTALERIGDIASPASLRRARETPVLDELARLKTTIGKPGRTVRMLGVPLKRTNEEYRTLVNEIGPQVEQVLGQLMASEEYRAATDEERTNAIDRVVTKLRADANARYKASKEEQVRQTVLRRRATASAPPSP